MDSSPREYRGALESYPGGKSVSGGNGSIYFTQNYIEFSQDSWGIFQVGNLTGPEDTLVESGFNLLQGANTIDGTFTNIVNFAEGVIEGVQMVGQTSKATKVAYYTPGMSTTLLRSKCVSSVMGKTLDSKYLASGHTRLIVLARNVPSESTAVTRPTM